MTETELIELMDKVKRAHPNGEWVVKSMKINGKETTPIKTYYLKYEIPTKDES